jgi:peptidoglycan hydrolase-like protein with peptidoglycan-binding domain
MAIQISESVGQGGSNRPDDVRAVQQRLAELGFNFFGAIDGTVSPGFLMAIRLFQSIIAGRHSVSGDGRIDPAQTTLRFLQASNAPRWQVMPLQGTGFVNHERQDASDKHDFGTHWMADTIRSVGQTYQTEYRHAHPKAALIAINDVSLPHGGDTPDHAGHETGLACDILLPHADGTFGGITWQSPAYDRHAMRAMLKAMRQQPSVSVVFFNDTQLISEGLCSRMAGHDNHAHFNIRPPSAV